MNIGSGFTLITDAGFDISKQNRCKGSDFLLSDWLTDEDNL
jgi:hypothetical protein